MAAKRPLTVVLGRVKELLAGDSLDVPNDADFRVAAAETRTVRIGNGRTGNGTVDLLFISDTSYPTYGLRIRRTATLSSFTHRGTGSLYFNAVEGYVTFATANLDRMAIDASGQISLLNGAGFLNGTAVTGAAGSARRWGVKTGTSVRWEWGADGAAESGANAGSNYVLRAYDDAGASLGDVMTVTRATRVAAFNVSPTVPTAAAGDNSTKAASTAYVDAAVAGVGGGGGSSQWTLVAVDTTMTKGVPYLVDASGGTRTMTLPATIAAGDPFVVRADGGSVVVASNGHTIDGVGAGNDLGLSDGQAVQLVAKSSSALELVSVQAVGGVNGAEVGSQIGFARTESTTAANTTASIPRDDTIPQSGEGAAYASLDTTYTPKSAASLLEVEVHLPYVSASGVVDVVFALFRDSGADAIYAKLHTNVANNYTLPQTFKVVVPATAAVATTFKLRWGVSSGTGYLLSYAGATGGIFGGADKASMTVREIKQ